MKNLILILALLLTGCGARKTAVVTTEEKKDSVAIVTVLKQVETEKKTEENISVSIIEEGEEITITPIDTTKEIVVNGKTYKNVVIKSKKKKSSNLYTNDIKASEKQRIDSTSMSTVVKKESKIQKTKNIDKKEAFNFKYILWLLLFLVILFIVRTISSFTKPLS
jgi:hypothetical protein